jgi:GLPGLI family protein
MSELEYNTKQINNAVIPAQAGISLLKALLQGIPAFAGMTGGVRKITILASIAFLSINHCFSQENGVVTYTVTHNWTKKMATCEYISKADRERSAYVWGNESEYVMNAELKFNAEEYRFDVRDDEEESTYRWRREDYIIYRDRSKGETFDVMTLLNKEKVVVDTLDCQQWKSKNDMKEIAGHICMNASFYDTVKGKEVIAWFALDLPIPSGPDKYCGLPGMILEINESNGAVVYTATSVLLSEEKVVIVKPTVKKKIKIITYEDYDKIVTDYIKECKKLQRPYFWGIGF